MLNKIFRFKASLFVFLLVFVLVVQSFNLNNIAPFLTTLFAALVSIQLVIVWFFEKTGIDLVNVANAIEKIYYISNTYGRNEESNRLIDEELKKIFK